MLRRVFGDIKVKMDAFHHSRHNHQNREQRDEKSQPLLKIGHYVLGDTLGVGTFGKVKGSVSVACSDHKSLKANCGVMFSSHFFKTTFLKILDHISCATLQYVFVFFHYYALPLHTILVSLVNILSAY